MGENVCEAAVGTIEKLHEIFGSRYVCDRRCFGGNDGCQLLSAGLRPEYRLCVHAVCAGGFSDRPDDRWIFLWNCSLTCERSAGQFPVYIPELQF